MPLFWRFGAAYNLDNGIKGSYQVNAGSKFLLTQKYEHKINDKTKFTVSTQSDLKAAFSDPKNAGF